MVMLDSTIVRAHQHAAGAPKKEGDQAIGRSRGGLTRRFASSILLVSAYCWGCPDPIWNRRAIAESPESQVP